MDWLWIGFAGIAGLAMLSFISHERQRRIDAIPPKPEPEPEPAEAPAEPH